LAVEINLSASASYNHPPDGRLLQIQTDEMGDRESAEGSWTSASEAQRPLLQDERTALGLFTLGID
jgi:hypothetical protein